MTSQRLTQAVILAGGAGTRLGDLTRSTPKPMLPVAGRPFISHLLEKAGRCGLERVLILAGINAQVMVDWIAESDVAAHIGLQIDIAVEPYPLGTGGALVFARDRLDDSFLLLNGDTWFDFDWRAILRPGARPWTMALRPIAEADRYETVELVEDRIAAFHPRSGAPRPGLINGGVYQAARDLIPAAAGPCSLEADILPELVASGMVSGAVFDAPFIDIGLPATYDQAQDLLRR